MKDLYQIALEIASGGHFGQKYGDEDFIVHPIGVAKNLTILFPEFAAKFPREMLIRRVVAIAHDLAEDTNITEKRFIGLFLEGCYSYLGKNSITTEEAITIREALEVLNKKHYKSYLEYIIACKDNEIARMVKMADLTYNLSTVGKGSLRDKYLLAMYILDNRFQA